MVYARDIEESLDQSQFNTSLIFPNDNTHLPFQATRVERWSASSGISLLTENVEAWYPRRLRSASRELIWRIYYHWDLVE